MHAASASVHLEVGQRVSAWLRREYPRDGAKLAAIEFDASPHTTKKWFAGALPENKHFAAMAARWGKRFVAFVYEPAVGPWRNYVLDEELAELKTRLAALEADLRDADDAGLDLLRDAAASRSGRPVSRAAGRMVEGRSAKVRAA